MTNAEINNELGRLCNELRLVSVAEHAPKQVFAKANKDPLLFLLNILKLEAKERKERRANRCIKAAGFPIIKTLAGFDFNEAKDICENLIDELSQCQFLNEARPIIFLGEPGTGKTHLATALGVCAASKGKSVRFMTTASLVTELVEAREAHALNKVVSKYGRLDLLILDEFGYLPLADKDAELLFRVLGERQERKAVIITTNLPFSEWTTMFPNKRLCRAIVDRMTHKAHIIETGSESMRLKQSLKQKKTKNGGKKQ